LPRRISIGSPGIRWKIIKARVIDPKRVSTYQPSLRDIYFRNPDRQNGAEKKGIFLFSEEVTVIIFLLINFGSYRKIIVVVYNTFARIDLVK